MSVSTTVNGDLYVAPVACVVLPGRHCIDSPRKMCLMLWVMVRSHAITGGRCRISVAPVPQIAAKASFLSIFVDFCIISVPLTNWFRQKHVEGELWTWYVINRAATSSWGIVSLCVFVELPKATNHRSTRPSWTILVCSYASLLGMSDIYRHGNLCMLA